MKKRFAQLDSLRLLALIFIIFYHFVPHIYRGGFLGVNIFLVSAGYLNGSQINKVFNQEYTSFPFWQKLKRLLAKLYKPLLLFIGLIATFLLVFYQDLLTNWFSQIASSLLFVNNWVQIIQGASYFDEIIQPSVLTHFWYLSLYVQFILFFWLLLKIFRPFIKNRQNFILLITTLTLISALLMAFNFQPGSDPTRVYYGSDTRFFSFGIGLIASQLSLDQINQTKLFQKYGQLVQIALFGALLAMLFEMTNVGTFTYYGGMVLFDLVFVSLIVSLASKYGLFSRLLTFKPLAFLGQHSLGVYLWYYPIFILSQRLAYDLPGWLQNMTGQVIIIFILGLLTDFATTSKWLTWPSWSKLLHLPGNIKDRFQSYLNQLPSKQKVLAGLQALLLTTTLLSFLFSTSNDEAQRYKEEYAQSTKSNQDLGQAQSEQNQDQESSEQNQDPESSENEEENPQENQEEFDVDDYIDNLNEDQAFYTEYLSKDELSQTINLQASFIGDSIMLGASAGLNTVYPSSYVNAEVGRQLYNSTPLIASLKDQGLLSPLVVIALGSNGNFTNDQFNQFIENFDPDTELYFVNTHVNRPWRDSVNSMLQNKAEEFDQVHVIDWFSYYQNIDQAILDTDNIHLNPEGRRHWVTCITKVLVEDLND